MNQTRNQPMYLWVRILRLFLSSLSEGLNADSRLSLRGGIQQCPIKQSLPGSLFGVIQSLL